MTDVCAPEESKSQSCCPYLARIEALEAAFPDGPLGHRKYHQTLIDTAEAQKKFWDELSWDLKAKGVKAVFLFFLAIVIYKFFGAHAVEVLFKAIF